MKYLVFIILLLFSISMTLYAKDLQDRLDTYEDYYDNMEGILNTCQEFADFASKCEKIIPPPATKENSKLEQL